MAYKVNSLFNEALNRTPFSSFFNFSYSHFNASNFGAILTFHKVTNASKGSKPSLYNDFIEITDEKFEEVIRILKNLKVEFCSLDRVLDMIAQNKKPSHPLVHISFDDGYLDNYTCAFPILKKYQIPFTLFIASSFIENKKPFLWWYLVEEIIKNELPISFDRYDFSLTAEDYKTLKKTAIFHKIMDFLFANIDFNKDYFEKKIWEILDGVEGVEIPKTVRWNQLKEMAASGLCEIGIHTVHHPRFCHIDLEQKMDEIKKCKQAILENTDFNSKFFAYPYGASGDIGTNFEYCEKMKEEGVIAACTTIAKELNGTNHPCLLPRIFINNSATPYTLKSRLNGSYQRSIRHEMLKS